MNQKHILVVDDDPGARYLIKQILEGAGYRVTTAEEGQSALQAAWSDRPDLVVTDVAMPVYDGVKTMAMFARDETLNVPFVVVSGVADPRDTTALFRAGARAFFTKPVDQRLFLAKVGELLAETRTVVNAGPF